MRSISSAALDKINTALGTEPLVLVEIFWGNLGNSFLYCDKKVDGVQGLILSKSSFDDIIRLDVGGNSQSIDLTLDDTDGHLKQIIDTIDIHKSLCIVKQWFSGISLNDAFELFRGEIHTPFTWNEGTREVQITVLSQIYTREAGFAPEEGQFPGVATELVGKVWPLGFGTPIHVPCTQSAEVSKATALSLGGVADATLTLKKEILEYRIAQIKSAYTFYNEMIDYLNDNIPSAQQIQLDYAYHSVGLSGFKQIVADLKEEFDQLTSELEKLYSELNDENSEMGLEEIDDLIEDVKNKRDDLIGILTKVSNQYVQAQDIENEYRRLISLSKFKLNFNNKIRKHLTKLQDDYVRFNRELTTVKEFIDRQILFCSSIVSILNAEQFQQNTDLLFNVKNVLLTGRIVDNVLTFTTVQPSYTNIVTQPRPADPAEDIPDIFWLVDPSFKLEGMYIYTDKGYIVKVIRQEGDRCQIQLPRKNRRLRNERRRVNYEENEKVKEIFDETMSRVLTGTETDQQKYKIASTIPSEVNPEVMKIINGQNEYLEIVVKKPNTLVGTEHNFSDKSYFVLGYFDTNSYDDDTDEPILFSRKFRFDDTANEMRSKFIRLAPWLSNVRVTFVETDGNTGLPTRIRFDYPDVSPHRIGLYSHSIVPDNPDESVSKLIMERQSLSDSSVSVTFDFAGLTPTGRESLEIRNTDPDEAGTYDIYINGKVTTIDLDDGDGAIASKLVSSGAIEESSDITITGAPLYDGTPESLETPLTLTLNNSDNGSILVDTSELVAIYDKKKLKNKLVRGIPRFYSIFGGSAVKYTRQEMEGILENEIKKTKEGVVYLKMLDVFNKLVKGRKQSLLNGYTQQEIDRAIFAAKKQLDMLKIKAQVPTVDSIVDNFDEKLYERLYELETISYLEFLSQIRLLDVEFKEDEIYEFTAKTFGNIVEASPIIIPRWLEFTNGITNASVRRQRIEALPRNTEPFYINVGDTISLEAAYQEVWVANILPSTVKAVYAYRNIDGLRRLVPVPSSYYSKNENDYYGRYNCTTITLARPLKSLDPAWDSQLYVTYQSSVGPNVVNVIRWLAEKYTSLVIDTVSFDEVETQVENYPVNFALFNKRNAIDLIQDIAWQARCLAWVNGGKLFLRYLPAEPESIATLTEDDIEQNSLILTMTPTEELITKYTATYKLHYAQNEPHRIVLRRNLTKYNEIMDERDYFIYNSRDLVYGAMTFWLIRRANTWRKVKMKLFPNRLALETNDVVTLNLSTNIVTDEPVKCLVETSVYDSETNTIDVELWLPVLINKKLKYKFAWPSDLSATDFFPEAEDITSGNAGDPFNLTVPTGEDYDPSGSLDQRPQDFGKAKVSDVGDILPISPAIALAEMDYKLYSAEEFLLGEDTDGEDDEEIIPDAPNIPEANGLNRPPELGVFVRLPPNNQEIEGQFIETVKIKVIVRYLSDGKEVIATPLDSNMNVQALRENDHITIYNVGIGEYKFHWQPSEAFPNER